MPDAIAIVSPTGRDVTLVHEALNDLVLFAGRVVAVGTVQAGNIAAPGAATPRDVPSPLAGLTTGRFSIEGMDPSGLYVEVEATADAGVTTVSFSFLLYLSEDGVTWHFVSATTFSDTTALISGNPSDVGLQAAGGTDFRAVGPLFGGPIIGTGPPVSTKYAAIAIRNNSIAASPITVSGRIVRRPT